MGFGAVDKCERQKQAPPAANRRARQRMAARCAGIVAAGCLALAVPAAPANAGFFDFLFGVQPAAPPPMTLYRRPPAHIHHQRSAHVERHRKKVAAPAAPRHRRMVAAAAPVLLRGPVDLMDDRSLKNGDAVMTADGLRVFVGDEGPRHAAEDFAAISETEGLSRSERGALLAVNAGHADAAGAAAKPAEPTPVMGRSAAAAGLSAGRTIVDPKGRTIRYVGP